MKMLLTTVYEFDQHALKTEATRQATKWIEVQDGRAVVFKALRKINLSGNSKTVEDKVKNIELQKRIAFTLTDVHECDQLKLSLFAAYRRECAAGKYSSCPPFTTWLEKRAANFKEQQRLLKEWKKSKAKTHVRSEALSKSVASALAVHKTLTTLLDNSNTCTVDVNKHLRTLNQKTIKSPRGRSSESENTWWNRYVLGLGLAGYILKNHEYYCID